MKLTPQQAKRRVHTCHQLIGNPMDDRFIRKIVTCDEKVSITATLAPGNSGSARVNLPKSRSKIGSASKVMLCVWWNFEGVIRWEFVPNGRSVDADLNYQQFERVREILRRRYPAIVNRNRVLLQQDNARSQTARTTKTKIQELGGIELLPHPAYSPDLAPSDYYLFRSMVHFLRGGNFENLEAVEVGVTELFASKSRD